jgi:hypothetical protein
LLILQHELGKMVFVSLELLIAKLKELKMLGKGLSKAGALECFALLCPWPHQCFASYPLRAGPAGCGVCDVSAFWPIQQQCLHSICHAVLAARAMLLGVELKCV